MTAIAGSDDFALGIDIGGTFIDLALLDRISGRQWTGKVLTDNGDLALGVIASVRALLAEHGIAPGLVRNVVHGTTLATNALIERRGARSALLTTRGFKDVLEFARESRYDIYDIDLDLPRPLIARARVFEVTERLDAKGEIVTPLAREELQSVAQELAAAGIEAIAICFLHSFRNPVHERAAAEYLHAVLPEVPISLSCEVSPDIREYERASTTAANAYVQPPVRSYLGQLEAGLEAIGIGGKLLVMTSDGGTISCETAAQFPVRILESGPAGGALAACHFGFVAGFRDLIAFDMGGTTAKVAVIDDGNPERSEHFEFGRVYRFAKGSGLPLNIPSIELIEIGAGGGSVAAVNGLGLLDVGPRSAGSSPGPACYMLGGEEPTVTDADLFLGYLDANFFLGGRLALDRALSVRAIETRVARPLDLPLLRAAWGIHEVVNNNMARAAKVHCLERGKDPRGYTLVAYGGAGPVHAYQVAALLDIGRVLFPPHAGVLSAFGFLSASPAFSLMQAYPVLLDRADWDRLSTIYQEMEMQGQRFLATAGVSGPAVTVRREAALRYAGQSFDLTVEVPGGRLQATTSNTIRDRFLATYRERFQQLDPDSPVELVKCRVVVTGRRPQLPIEPRTARSPTAAKKGTRQVYVPEWSRFAGCPVYDRATLVVGTRFTGPAVVEEPESTAVIGADAAVEVLPGNILLATLPGRTTTPRDLATASVA